MALVEPPRPVDRDPHQVEIVERDPQRPDGPLQDGRVGDVEPEVRLRAASRCGIVCLCDASLGQVDVGPAGEPVLSVPCALTVAQQDEDPGPRPCVLTSSRCSIRPRQPKAVRGAWSLRACVLAGSRNGRRRRPVGRPAERCPKHRSTPAGPAPIPGRWKGLRGLVRHRDGSRLGRSRASLRRPRVPRTSVLILMRDLLSPGTFRPGM